MSTKKTTVTVIARDFGYGLGISFNAREHAEVREWMKDQSVWTVNVGRYNKDLRHAPDSTEPVIITGLLASNSATGSDVTLTKAAVFTVRQAAVNLGLSPFAVEMAVDFARRNYTGTVADLWVMAEAVAA